MLMMSESLVQLKEYLNSFEDDKLRKAVENLLDKAIWPIDLRRKEAI
jgi:hypothetical protein